MTEIDDGLPGGVIGRLMRAFAVRDLLALAIRMGQPEASVKGWALRDEVPIWALKLAAERAGVDLAKPR